MLDFHLELLIKLEPFIKQFIYVKIIFLNYTQK